MHAHSQNMQHTYVKHAMNRLVNWTVPSMYKIY